MSKLCRSADTCHLLLLADLYNAHGLKRVCMATAIEDMQYLTNSPGFDDLVKNVKLMKELLVYMAK